MKTKLNILVINHHSNLNTAYTSTRT